MSDGAPENGKTPHTPKRGGNNQDRNRQGFGNSAGRSGGQGSPRGGSDRGNGGRFGDSGNGERREWKPREGGDRKPYQQRDGGSGERREWKPREGASGDRKPYQGNNSGERREWKPREGGDRKPYQGNNSGERREWKPREGGDRKPYQQRDGGSGERREWKPREGASGDRKPYQGNNSGERREWKPREGGDRKPYQGNNSGERREWKPREGGDRKPYQGNNSGERREWKPREGGDRKPYQGNNSGERREWKPREDRDRRPANPNGERREWKPREDRSSSASFGRGGTRGDGRSDRGGRDREFTEAERLAHELRPVRASHRDPIIPEDVTPKDLHPGARNELKTLDKELADLVAVHLAMAARLIEVDPELAHQHAISATRRAGRIPVARETLAITSYVTGDYAGALRELRTYRRLSGSDQQLALMIDCERALGRPERALETGRSVDIASLTPEVQVGVAIAMSGARLDLGQAQQALFELEIPQLDPNRAYSWSPELFNAYAEVLIDLGRERESAEWRHRAVVAEEALGERFADVETVEVFDLDPEEEWHAPRRDAAARVLAPEVSAEEPVKPEAVAGPDAGDEVTAEASDAEAEAPAEPAAVDRVAEPAVAEPADAEPAKPEAAQLPPAQAARELKPISELTNAELNADAEAEVAELLGETE